MRPSSDRCVQRIGLILKPPLSVTFTPSLCLAIKPVSVLQNTDGLPLPMKYLLPGSILLILDNHWQIYLTDLINDHQLQ